MKRSGFALMAALWLLIAISTVSLELSAIARGRRLSVVNKLESERAGFAAESGIEHARARLVRMIAESGGGQAWRDPVSVLDPWRSAATAIHDSVLMNEGAAYQVTALDLGATLNINRATEDELRAFLTAKSINAIAVDDLTQTIMN